MNVAPAPAHADPAPIQVENFLGVGRSAQGRAWRARAADDQLALAHARLLDAPEALGRVLAGRGVALEDGAAFLAPTLRDTFPDPGSFADMDAAASALADAIETGRGVAVFADYDVDGATSAAQLIRYFRARGRDMDLYVPDRVEEGYGPTGQAFSALKARGAELVVTVDCGAMAHEALASAAAIGLEVVVLDHHQMTAAPPEARAVVNPNRADCKSGCGHLAAAGVTFVTLAALNRECRRRGHFKDGGEPDLMGLLDLAALGTFCDVVPLVGFNRAVAAQGLKMMDAGANPGIAALRKAAGGTGAASAHTAGFVLGPRINAGGRVGRADLGARLLSTDDLDEAASIAEKLDAFNVTRRAVEQGVLDAAMAAAHAQPAALRERVLIVAGEGWHQGVIGIVAGRLKERFDVPTIVIGAPSAANGVDLEPAKGSGRSVTGVDLGAAIAAAREAGLLIAGGGHAMAAGLTIDPARVDALREFLDSYLRAAGEQPPPVLTIDALVSARALNRAFADSLARAAPYGAGNPEPVLAVADVCVRGSRALGDGSHLRVTFEDAGGQRFDAVAFRCVDTPLGAAISRPGAPLHVAVTLTPGRGRYVDIHIKDVAAAG